MQETTRGRQAIAVAAGVLACSLAASTNASAQDITDLKTHKSPLVLKAHGSFFLGGERVNQTAIEAGGFGFFPGGNITIRQMYVQYMIPDSKESRVPVVMVHGGTLSAKSYETTPDGRMGWDEYFVRKGYPVYKPDQVSRARSGFNQAVYNNVRAGLAPPSSQPLMTRLSDESSWTIFRFGPSPGVPFPDTQFPIAAADKFSKQSIPDMIGGPNAALLAGLAVQLKGAVIMGHSQSGGLPVQTALANPAGIKGLISLEPNSCSATDAQIAILAKIPIIVMFGDHLGEEAPGSAAGIGLAAVTACQTFASRLNAAGGKATVVVLPAIGIKGNSHMFMLDKNNLQVADVLLKWLDRSVKSKKGHHDDDDDDHHDDDDDHGHHH